MAFSNSEDIIDWDYQTDSSWEDVEGQMDMFQDSKKYRKALKEKFTKDQILELAKYQFLSVNPNRLEQIQETTFKSLYSTLKKENLKHGAFKSAFPEACTMAAIFYHVKKGDSAKSLYHYDFFSQLDMDSEFQSVCKTANKAHWEKIYTWVYTKKEDKDKYIERFEAFYDTTKAQDTYRISGIPKTMKQSDFEEFYKKASDHWKKMAEDQENYIKAKDSLREEANKAEKEILKLDKTKMEKWKEKKAGQSYNETIKKAETTISDANETIKKASIRELDKFKKASDRIKEINFANIVNQYNLAFEADQKKEATS